MSATPLTPTDASELEHVSIGVLTALEKEYAACREVFDPDRRGREKTTRATSGMFVCWLCRIATVDGGEHVVAISLLPEMGNNAAAIGANMLLQHCPNVRQLIMCGIAGAIPNSESSENHVRLGDIVVSDGVIQFDRGKQHDPRSAATVPISPHLDTPLGRVRPGFEVRAAPHRPSPELTQVVKLILAEIACMRRQLFRPWELTLKSVLSRLEREWKRPPKSKDVLHDTDTGVPVLHPDRHGARRKHPRLFVGPIASSNMVLGDPKIRDALRDTYKVKAVEMEGSGIADVSWIGNIGYLIVRGTCDYCDAIKNRFLSGICG